jgi:hypothetical protein
MEEFVDGRNQTFRSIEYIQHFACAVPSPARIAVNEKKGSGHGARIGELKSLGALVLFERVAKDKKENLIFREDLLDFGELHGCPDYVAVSRENPFSGLEEGSVTAEDQDGRSRCRSG